MTLYYIPYIPRILYSSSNYIDKLEAQALAAPPSLPSLPSGRPPSAPLGSSVSHPTFSHLSLSQLYGDKNLASPAFIVSPQELRIVSLVPSRPTVNSGECLGYLLGAGHCAKWWPALSNHLPCTDVHFIYCTKANGRDVDVVIMPIAL